MPSAFEELISAVGHHDIVSGERWERRGIPNNGNRRVHQWISDRVSDISWKKRIIHLAPIPMKANLEVVEQRLVGHATTIAIVSPQGEQPSL